MADLGLVVAVEQVGVRLGAGERARPRAASRMLRRPVSTQRTPRPAPAAGGSVRALVGGDAAADDEEDALVREHQGFGLGSNEAAIIVTPP